MEFEKITAAIVSALTTLLFISCTKMHTVMPPVDAALLVENTTGKDLRIVSEITFAHDGARTEKLDAVIEPDACVRILDMSTDTGVQGDYNQLFRYITEGTVTIYTDGSELPTASWTLEERGKTGRNIFCPACMERTEQVLSEIESIKNNVRFIFSIKDSDLAQTDK